MNSSKQTLVLSGFNLNTRRPFVTTIKASSPMTMAQKYSQFDMRNNHVEMWTLINGFGQMGNKGLNADSYLHQTMEELVGHAL